MLSLHNLVIAFLHISDMSSVLICYIALTVDSYFYM